MLFRRKPVREEDAEQLYDPSYQTAGRRLDVPLRMAASIDRTLAQFSTDDEHVAQWEADEAVRLVGQAIDLSTDRVPEDLVADALDRVEWTVPLIKVARGRSLWDDFWDNAVEETRLEQRAAAARAARHEAEEARATAEAAADRQRRKSRLWEEERRERERYEREQEGWIPGLGEKGSVERAAFVFHICGVPNADRLDAGDLWAAWVKLMVRHHPDTSGTGVDVQEVNAAYDVLREHSAARPATRR